MEADLRSRSGATCAETGVVLLEQLGQAPGPNDRDGGDGMPSPFELFGTSEVVSKPEQRLAVRAGAAQVEAGDRRIRRKITMTDTTIKKVSSEASPRGGKGQIYLASGKGVSMRLWKDEAPTDDKEATSHDYEVVGYVISGRAELEIEGQMVKLEPGDSWAVPKGATHRYRILEPFTAVEATSPPAEYHGRGG